MANQYLPPDVAERLEARGPRVPAPAALESLSSEWWDTLYSSENGPPGLSDARWAGLRRRRLRHIKLGTLVTQQWAGKHLRNCGQCSRAKMHGDPRRGFCAVAGIAISLGHSVLCQGYR